MVFKFEEDGEPFMIGSQVGRSMNLLKGALYKRFPNLWRRCVTSEERQLLNTIGISYNNLSNANIMLVKEKEIDDILKGNAHAYSPCSSPKRSPGRPQRATFYKPTVSSFLSQTQPSVSPSADHSSAIHLTAVGSLTTSLNPKGNTVERKLRRIKIMPHSILRYVFCWKKNSAKIYKKVNVLDSVICSRWDSTIVQQIICRWSTCSYQNEKIMSILSLCDIGLYL